MKSRPVPRAGARKGSALVYSVLLLTLAGVAVISITLLVNENLRATKRSEDRLQAFYAAEAGVQEVVDWFNRGYYAWLEPQLPENQDEIRTNDIALHDWDDNVFDREAFQQLFAPDAASGRYTDLNGHSVFAARLTAAGLSDLSVEERSIPPLFFM